MYDRTFHFIQDVFSRDQTFYLGLEYSGEKFSQTNDICVNNGGKLLILTVIKMRKNKIITLI